MARTTAPIATLESWLTDATRYLCDEAVAQIRAETTDHYETALTAGQTPQAVLESLGDPRTANCSTSMFTSPRPRRS